MPDELIYDETMTGWFSPASVEPSRGYAAGRRHGLRLEGGFRIVVHDVDRFIREPAHEAELQGALSATGLGEELEFQDGRFNLCHQAAGGVKHMVYRFHVHVDGSIVRFVGRKELFDDPSAWDNEEGLTALFVRLFQKDGSQKEAESGAGIMHLRLRDLPLLMASIHTPGASGEERLRIAHRYFGFAFGDLARTVLFALR